jgi:flagellar basal-body rod protein FlgF
MDKMIYTAFNTLNNIYDNRSVRAQNMANLNVPGYRRDLGTKSSGSAFLEGMNTLNSRAFAVLDDKNSFQGDPGTLSETGMETDVAIRGEGYFLVKGLGEPSLSRRGDMSVDINGFLVNGAKQKMLDENLNEINIPPYRRIKVADSGEVTIEPLGSPVGTQNVIARIGMVSERGVELKKFPDGEIRASDGTIPPVNGDIRLIPKFIELSNVNITEELVNTIEDQRAYEVNVKLLTSASELDEASASLLRLPR